MLSIDGDKVTIQISGGSYSRRVQTGGSPAGSKEVTGHTSSYYDDGVYSGSLTSYVYSGEYIPADSKSVTHYMSLSGSGLGNDPKYAPSFPSTYYYSSGGYSGTIPKTHGPIFVQGNEWGAVYQGTVTKPASDTRVYRYRGTVFKPDTRTYDYYYQYNIDVEYTDNQVPVIVLSSPSNNQTIR